MKGVGKLGGGGGGGGGGGPPPRALGVTKNTGGVVEDGCNSQGENRELESLIHGSREGSEVSPFGAIQGGRYEYAGD
jgi:hypothetical protein